MRKDTINITATEIQIIFQEKSQWKYRVDTMQSKFPERKLVFIIKREIRDWVFRFR